MIVCITSGEAAFYMALVALGLVVMLLISLIVWLVVTMIRRKRAWQMEP